MTSLTLSPRLPLADHKRSNPPPTLTRPAHSQMVRTSPGFACICAPCRHRKSESTQGDWYTWCTAHSGFLLSILRLLLTEICSVPQVENDGFPETVQFSLSVQSSSASWYLAKLVEQTKISLRDFVLELGKNHSTAQSYYQHNRLPRHTEKPPRTFSLNHSPRCCHNTNKKLIAQSTRSENLPTLPPVRTPKCCRSRVSS